jgi:hypothetical protein
LADARLLSQVISDRTLSFLVPPAVLLQKVCAPPSLPLRGQKEKCHPALLLENVAECGLLSPLQNFRYMRI